jgi:hypothetical protein
MEVLDRTAEANALKELEMRNNSYPNPTAAVPCAQGQTTNDLSSARLSVTEHTTHQLKQKL